MVQFPIVLLIIVLVGFSVILYIQSGYDHGYTYRRSLATRYNETQGGTNDYLDQLHEQQFCCGTRDMKTNIANDTTVFEPANGMVTRFPRSCCRVLEEHQNCSSTNIYRRPCDVLHYQRVKLFDYVTVPLVVIALLWKLSMIAIYRSNENSLFG